MDLVTWRVIIIMVEGGLVATIIQMNSGQVQHMHLFRHHRSIAGSGQQGGLRVLHTTNRVGPVMDINSHILKINCQYTEGIKNCQEPQAFIALQTGFQTINLIIITCT
jgi:hypothetical protein